MELVGSLGFIVGAQGHITESGDGQSASLAAVNTLLSTGSAGLCGLIYLRMKSDSYNIIRLVNAALTGLASIYVSAD